MAGSAVLNPVAILTAARVLPGMHIADLQVDRNGHLVFPAAQMVGLEGKVYGVHLVNDVLNMLEGRRRQYLVHNLELVQGDIQAGDLDIPEASLDRVFMLHTLATVSDHAQIVAEIRRLLKADGVVVVIDWHPQTQHPIAPKSEFRLHPNRVDSAFMQGGCEVCGHFNPSEWHWGRMYRRL